MGALGLVFPLAFVALLVLSFKRDGERKKDHLERYGHTFVGNTFRVSGPPKCKSCGRRVDKTAIDAPIFGTKNEGP